MKNELVDMNHRESQRLNTDCTQTMVSNGVSVSPGIGIGRATGGDGDTLMAHDRARGTYNKSRKNSLATHLIENKEQLLITMMH